MNTDDFWDGAHQPGGDINQSVDTARFVQPNPDNSKEETKKLSEGNCYLLSNVVYYQPLVNQYYTLKRLMMYNERVRNK